jgi:acyl-coenzyme A thioesterase PaaI-like protein
MEEIIQFFKKDKFATNSGIELLKVSSEYAKAKMEIEENHLSL